MGYLECFFVAVFYAVLSPPSTLYRHSGVKMWCHKKLLNFLQTKVFAIKCIAFQSQFCFKSGRVSRKESNRCIKTISMVFFAHFQKCQLFMFT